MTKSQVLALLKKNQNERGIANWKKSGGRLKTFGIGLTQLRKFAKQIGRDHKLAQQLWKSDNYDVRIISLLIDDPKLLSREQVEDQVEDVRAGHLAHVFSSCDATLSKAPFAFELACDWIQSKDDTRKSCGYGLLYELSKKNIRAMDDDFCLDCIDNILDTIDGEDRWVRGAMGGALMGIGKRNKKLNKAAIRAAKKIGPIDLENGCEPFDVLKHLTSDYLKEKLAK